VRTEHTPGPWHVKRSGTIVEKATGDLVATCGKYRTNETPKQCARRIRRFVAARSKP